MRPGICASPRHCALALAKSITDPPASKVPHGLLPTNSENLRCVSDWQSLVRPRHMDRPFMGARVMSQQVGTSEAQNKALIVCQPIPTPYSEGHVDG
jgi:hypothetical protein